MRRAEWIGLAVLLLWSASCGGPTKERVVGFLFDDPPPSAEENEESRGEGESAESEDAAATTVAGTEGAGPVDTIEAPIELVEHSPFEDRDCEACHHLEGSLTFRGKASSEDHEDVYEDESGARLRIPRQELCFECHDDMTADELADAGENVHPPAEEGDCLDCHDPHASRWASLLRGGTTPREVCAPCHDEDEFEDTESHEGLVGEERDCWTCHEAHASDEDYLLKS